MANAATLSTPSNDAANYRWLIIVTIMLVAILEVLDSTIVNVALPSMMPALSANSNQITWVLTAYIVASAIMLPLTGYLSNRLGRQRMMLLNITGFLIGSLASGLSTSMVQMVLFRCIQGACGAALIPLSQSILRESFPLHEQGKAMAIWGLGIMMAPVMGPTLGGYITENLSWRWVFYINVPVCLIALALTYWVIPQTAIIKQKIDRIGLWMMVIAIACLQIFLDQGNEKSWFTSSTILALALISTFCFAGFIYRSFCKSNSAVNLRLYNDHNFAIACITMLAFAGCLFGLLAIQPIMLEQVFNYPIITTGWVLAPIGLASAIGMVSSSMIMNHVNVKWLVIPGLSLCAISAWFFSQFNLNAPMHDVIIANALQGLGMGLVMVPLSTYALASIPQKHITEASGLFSYSRMLGTSVGISLISTLVTREQQIHWNALASQLTPFSSNVTNWLAIQHLSVQNPLTAHKLGSIVQLNASMGAYLDAYTAIAIAFALLIPLVALLKPIDFRTNNDAA